MTGWMMELQVHVDIASLPTSLNIQRFDDAFAGTGQHADAPCLLSMVNDSLLLGWCCMWHCRNVSRQQAVSRQ